MKDFVSEPRKAVLKRDFTRPLRRGDRPEMRCRLVDIETNGANGANRNGKGWPQMALPCAEFMGLGQGAIGPATSIELLIGAL